MTVETSTSKAQALGNGSQTAFPFAFRIFAATDLVVTRTVIATGVDTVLVLNTDYTVAGAGDYDGGTVTCTVAPASGTRLTVQRVLDIVQQTDLRNQGSFAPEVHEDEFDRLTMVDQQQQEQLDRSLALPASVAGTVSGEVPLPVARRALIWNADANALELTSYDPDTLQPAASAAASAAATSATAAATSASNAATSATGAATSAAAAAASAASINLPSATGNAGRYLRQKTDETGLEYRTAAQSRSDLAVPVQAARVDVASAATLDITGTAPNSDDIRITGTTTVTAVNLAANRVVRAVFGGSLTLTNNANIVTQTGANIVTQAGDTCLLRATAANTVEILFYTRAFEAAATGVTGKSMIKLNTGNGHGSTATKIRRFSTPVTSQGSDITYTDSATNGASFTVNAAGVYAVSYTDQFSAASTLGISLNASSLTTNVIALAAAEQASCATANGADVFGFTGWTGYLAAGTVVRAHTHGVTGGSNQAGVNFTIARVA